MSGLPFELRDRFLSRYHPGTARVLDCAGNEALWAGFGDRVERVGYDYEGAAEAGLQLEYGKVGADVVDIGGADPWSVWADALAGMIGTPFTAFLTIRRSDLRLDGGLPRFVWERAGVPFDWSRWNGPRFDGLVLRAGLSYAEERGFRFEEAAGVRFFGKPFPWRYNHVGLRLVPEWR
jgi:hypothetical protein